MNGVAFKPDNLNILVSCSNDDTIKMWDITSGSCLLTLKVDAGYAGVQCVKFNGTGDTIVAGDGDGKIFFIDTATSQVREPPLKVDAGAFGVKCVTLNGTGDTIVVGCYNGNIFFIDTATSQVREPPLTGHTGPVWGVAFSADGQWVIAGFRDGMIRLLDAHPRGGTVVSAV